MFYVVFGGKIEDVKEVFGEDVVYLKSVVSCGEEVCLKFLGEFYFIYGEFIKRLKKYFFGLRVDMKSIFF